MDATRAAQRTIAMSRSGRLLATLDRAILRRIDSSEATPERRLSAAEVLDFEFVGNALWVLSEAGVSVLDDDSGVLGEPAATPGGRRIIGGPADDVVVVIGEDVAYFVRVAPRGGVASLTVEAIDFQLLDGALVVPCGGKRLLIGRAPRVGYYDVGRGTVTTASVPEGDLILAHPLFGGRCIAVLTQDRSGAIFQSMRPSGALIHRIRLPRIARAAIGETTGWAVLSTEDGELIGADLQHGALTHRESEPRIVEELVTSTDGMMVAVAAADLAETKTRWLHLQRGDLFGSDARSNKRNPLAAATIDLRATPEGETGPVAMGAAASRAVVTSGLAGTAPLQAERPQGDAEGSIPAPARERGGETATLPPVIPLALGRPALTPVGFAAFGKGSAAPYAHADDYLEATLVVTSLAVYRAIARAWRTGKLSDPVRGAEFPHQREVLALAGAGGQPSDGALMIEADADARYQAAFDLYSERVGATIAAGVSLPMSLLAEEFGLGEIETSILTVVMAPQLRGEIARLYAIFTDDAGRSICDRHLVETLVSEGDARRRAAVGRALAPEATLVRRGLVRIDPSRRPPPYAALFVDEAILHRMQGRQFAMTSAREVTTIREAGPGLDELAMSATLKREVLLAAAAPTTGGPPLRMVIRGRRGSGRRSLLSALAGLVGKPLAVIDAERLPQSGMPVPVALERELHAAALRGAVPCVSGLGPLDVADADTAQELRAVLRGHPGPIVFRATPEASLPLDPGFVSFTIEPLSEGERHAYWERAASARGIVCDDLGQLASRYRIGPGMVETVLAAAQTEVGDRLLDPREMGQLLDGAARRHIDSRMNQVATKITRLASWEQVALPDDVSDSIKEFIGRVRYRRTVYETWGFDERMSSSRGLTALFYGPPGTGKSMVAGLIAHELGLDLYRVDLARITSKWIGETEKNLAEIFDAGEDGQCVILFDEADSLFAKRTEVKSSVDRYANLEVNYLLQRFDTFEGIAILTTNLEGSIDPAFRRRMSLRLTFPFPDEEMRERLWKAHIPKAVPLDGKLDFAELAHRFPLSGGYIRNSALRAAFLAAQENVPLSQQHLIRAIQLEYRELGKLSAGGRVE